MSETAFPERARSVRQRMAGLGALKSASDEARELSGLFEALAKAQAKLAPALDVLKALRAANIDVAISPKFRDVRKRARSLREKFEADQRAATLKKGVTWSNWLDLIDDAASELNASSNAAWKAYQGQVFSGHAPGVVKARLAQTPSNRAAFGRYEKAYDAFRAAFKQLPDGNAAIEAARARAAELETIARDFDFDVPSEVKIFLEAVQTTGAPLDLLTPSVEQWLKANGSSDQYRIVAQRQT